jgi:Transmembrane protein 43
VVGAATAQSPIEDSDVGLTLDDQVAVARTAEMYQWKEDKKEETQNDVGGSTTTTTTYDYSRVWSDHPINSSEFKHQEMTWVLRGVGTLLMVVGFVIFLAPLSTLASVIPILGDLVGGAVTLVSVAIGVPLSILVIAFAWLTFRPLIGGGLILVALAVGYLLWRWRSKSRAPAVPAGAPAK